MKRSQIIFAAALLAGFVLAGGGPVHAQTPFAMRSVGQRLADGDARMLGRGGWGLTETDSLSPGFKNPASAAWVRQVGLSLTGYGETGSHESPAASRRTYRTYVPDLRVALPLRKGELALTAGFKLERATGWHTQVDSLWIVGQGNPLWTLPDTLSGNTQFEREGSVFKVPLGVAWRVLPTLAGAVSLNLERGSLRESLADYFTGPATSSGVPFYRSVIAVNEDQFSGTSATVAALFTPRPALRLAVSWTGEHTIDVSRKSETGGVAQRGSAEFEITRPSELSLGVSAPLAGRWELGADLRRQDWRKLVAPETWLAEPGWQDQLAEEIQFGFGVERRRGTERRAGWSNLPVRVGAGWHRWPYRVAGQEIVEKSLSVGTGFPLRGDAGHLDVALTYGSIGDQSENGLSSKYVRLAVSVTGLEAWW
jgi:hypothetical protein